MALGTSADGTFTVTGYSGDAKVLLAFNFTETAAEARRHRLAGFTIRVEPPDGAAYYLWNNLEFETPGIHVQVDSEPAYSTANAPIHKFRWVHVPGLDHQGLTPPFGTYTYVVIARYFDDQQHMTAMNETRDGARVSVELAPFSKNGVKLGFTRGFVQSQAFVRHFGNALPTRPKNGPLDYDTSKQAGVTPDGQAFSYAQQYRWLGFTARDRVFEILDWVRQTDGARIDVFAYDLNEPDVIKAFLDLRDQGKIRIVLDNADLHHDPSDPTPEDQFEELFKAGDGASHIKRGKFGRYAHDKIFVVYQGTLPLRVLTGSTNYSVTGLYVNSNHVIVFEDSDIVGLYASLFAQVWRDGPVKGPFAASALAAKPYSFPATATRPLLDVTFSPHEKAEATARLGEIVTRCQAEAAAKGNVFFAVMEMASGAANPVYTALNALHANPDLFSYGISDHPDGISLYPVGSTTGVLVTGKPGRTDLPAPFNQVPSVGSGHQIHHKFVVCGFKGDNPAVYCGSSNLALAGEQVNGDNLLCIQDGAVATAFVIEALLLIDHFNFLDSMARAPAGKGAAAKTAAPPPDKRSAAVQAHWYLGTTDQWAAKYFDPADLHCRDREMFA